MRLKALEMQGFKSFPDKTRLNFENGVTGVVGPNGSGKSNITDAVRWVLGEMSTKNIRGTKMEDVIFGGSDNRRPMNYAEVTLFIDNTQGLGRLESEYDEVSVTRRYYRGGDSEYLINGQKSRLRDISELFMNTGVGKTGYSNIGQGKIAEIISQKSDERRSVFEEAAGISKFRVRKNEAERKLKETEANLLRVGDVLSDLEGRVGPLEKESAAAKKYLELYEQKKEVDVALWLYDAENMRATADETEKLYVASKLELESVDGMISSANEKSEILFAKASENTRRAEELSEKIDSAISEKHGIESSSRVLENDIRHIEDRILSTRNDLTDKKNQLENSRKNGERLVSSIEEKQNIFAETEKSIKEFEEETEAQRLRCKFLEDKILERDDERQLKDAELTDLKVKLSALDGSHEVGSGRLAELREQKSKLGESLAALSDSRKRTEEKINEYSENLSVIDNGIKEKNALLDGIAEKSSELYRKLSENTVAVEAKKQRAETLRRMDELLEGYNYSVKNVMRAYENGAINGICGPVSRIISVRREYSIAVETALGANLQNIVTEDEQAAKNAISYLKKTNGGRATFYPITSVKSRQPAVGPDLLKKHKGYVGMGDTLCSFDKKYEGIIGYLLGGTAVFDNLDNASYSAKAFGYRIRIVTLDGQLINAGGSFTGGSVKTDSGILTRSSEISAINDEITKLELSARALNASVDELEKKKNSILGELDELGGRTSILRTLLQNEMTALEVIKTKEESEQSKLNEASDTLGSIDEENVRYDSERSDICWKIKLVSDEITECEKAVSDAREESDKADNLLSDTERKLNELRIGRAALDAEIQSMLESAALGVSTVNALEEQIRLAEESIVGLEEKLETSKAKITEQSVSTADIDIDIEKLDKEKKELIRQNLSFEKIQTEIRQELGGLNQKRDTLFREYTRLESKREQLTADHDRLAAKIWEDYELTYTTATELNYAPVTPDSRSEYGKRQTELRNKLRSLGHVNVNAIDEYTEVKTKYDFTKTQYEDLTRSQESLNGIITRIEREMKVKFETAFEEINKNFKVTFKELFGGGNAEILLTDPENVLTSGIEINVAPPGKIIKNLISLSGGEQSFVAIALIFAILNVNPTPFCIFDEIESALDEVNVIRLAEYMKRYSEKTQFVVITHRRGTMEAADMLYGITMPDRGISKVLSMNVNEAEQRLKSEEK